MCAIYLEWYSSVACKRSISDTSLHPDEVMCYVYNEQYQKFDLTPLIKQHGGYSVKAADENTQFLINVCRDITAG